MDLKKLKMLGVATVASLMLSPEALAACTSLTGGTDGNLDPSSTATWTETTAASIDEVCTVSSTLTNYSFGTGGTVASVATDNTGTLLIAGSAAMVGTIGTSSLKLGLVTVSSGNNASSTGVAAVSGGITGLHTYQLDLGLANGVLNPATMLVSGAVTIASGATIGNKTTGAATGQGQSLLTATGNVSVTSGAIVGGGVVQLEGGDITFGSTSTTSVQTNVINISAASANTDITFTASHALTGNVTNNSGTAGNGITVTFEDDADASLGSKTLLTGNIGLNSVNGIVAVETVTVAIGSQTTGTSAANIKTLNGKVYTQNLNVTGTAAGQLTIGGELGSVQTITTSVPIVLTNGVSASSLSTINITDGMLTEATTTSISNGDDQVVIDAENNASGTLGGFDFGSKTLTTSGAVTFNLPATFTSGHMNLVSTSAAFTANQTKAFGLGTSALVDYTMFVLDSGKMIGVSASQKSTASVAAGLGLSTAQASTVISSLSFISGAQLAALTSAIKTTAGAQQAAKQMSVQEDLLTATTAAVASVTTSNVNVNTGRLAALRGFNPKVEGYTADDHTMQGVWGEFFGNFASQDERDGVDGFDADTTGLTVGYDRALNSKVNIGGSLTLSDTEVEGQGAGQSNLDIKSYIFNAYGDYSTEKWFVEGLVGFGFSDNTATRRLTFGGLNSEASAQFDGQQIVLYAGYGRNYKLGNWNFIPVGSLTYANVANDDYNESGLGDLNLRVDQESISLAIIQAAARFNRRYAVGTDMDFIPELRVNLGFDAAGDEANATSSFQGSSTVFESTGADVAQFLYGMGFGAGLNTGDFTASFNYDLDGRADFWGHNVSLTGKWEF